MIDHSKKYINASDLRRAGQALKDYQTRHNIIRKDYEELLRLTDSFKNDEKKFDALFRASLKSFFCLLESDIYGLNQIHEHPIKAKNPSFIITTRVREDLLRTAKQKYEYSLCF